MKFTSVPAGFTSFREPLPYSFDAEGAPRDITFTIVDVESGATIGAKKTLCRHCGRDRYRPLSPPRRPLPHARRGGRVLRGRHGWPRQGARGGEGVASPVRTFIAAKVADDKLYALLTTQYDRRAMAADEFDAIGYFAMPDAVVEIVVEAFGSGYERLVLTPPAAGSVPWPSRPEASLSYPSRCASRSWSTTRRRTRSTTRSRRTSPTHAVWRGSTTMARPSFTPFPPASRAASRRRAAASCTRSAARMSRRGATTS